MKQYSIPLLLIVLWWTLAFAPSKTSSKGPVVLIPGKSAPFHLGAFATDRPWLKRALDGDVDAMLCLIAKWDAEAESLENEKGTSIERLTRAEYLEAFCLSDKTEHVVPRYFFPQTYLSAGILVALTNPSSLKALPSGLRKQEHIYPSRFLSGVKYDADPYRLDAIDSPEDTIAFVSPYSHPSTLVALSERGIPLVQIEAPHSVEEICEAIEQVGSIAGNPEKGRLLSLFVKATGFLLNNRVRDLDHSDTLLLQHFTHLSVPTDRLLMGKTAKSLGLLTLPETIDADAWSIPLELEDLVRLSPKKIILACEHPEKATKLFQNIPLDCTIYVLDKETYDTSSQYFFLSYFDLCQILAEGK